MLRLPAALCAFALLLPAAAQDVLQSFEGSLHNGYFGLSIARAGDLDGDGRDELIVGSGGRLPWLAAAGAAAVYRFDGSLLHRFDAGPEINGFGIAVSGAGDVNADGYDDVIVGVPEDRSHVPRAGGLAGNFVGHTGHRGSARVFSGRDGTLLHLLLGPPRISHLFGWAVGRAGDVDGDGHDDVLVTQHSEGTQELNTVRVFSGVDGSVLREWEQSSFFEFGHVVTGVGDLDGDGRHEVAVGAPFEWVDGERVGVVRIYAGRDGALLRSHVGDVPYGIFGADVAAVGDLDGDGVTDVAVGAPGHFDPGEIRVYAGLDGRELFRASFSGTSGFGFSVDAAGDVDGDGTPDVLVGDPWWNGGAVHVVSGSDGASIFRESTKGFAELGHAVCGVGDWNGDGFADLAASLPGRKEGVVKVFDGRPRRGTSYCGPATRNSTGRPAEVAAHGSVLVQRNDLTLRATALPPARMALFLVGSARDLVPFAFGSQGSLCLTREGVGAYLDAPLTADASGAVTLPIDLALLPTSPPQGVLPGQTWHFQCWYRDSNPGATSNFTDAVSVGFH